MKQLQFIALLFGLSISINTGAMDQSAKCNVIPKISTTAEGTEVKFRVIKDKEELGLLDNIELAINTACKMQNNNECFYSSSCK